VPPYYTTSAAVESHLDRTFTATQLAEADSLLAAADAWITSRLPYSYPQTALITEEFHLVEGPYLFLNRTPVTSVTSVTVRSRVLGAATTALVVGTNYDLLDATAGMLRIAGYLGGEALVSYTPAIALDPRLETAAKKLVAFWLRPLLEGVSGDVQSYSIGQELQVTFKQDSRTLGIPDEVVALVDSIYARGMALA
jgi:hypothetical protein